MRSRFRVGAFAALFSTLTSCSTPQTHEQRSALMDSDNVAVSPMNGRSPSASDLTYLKQKPSKFSRFYTQENPY
ncbi:MAG: hypothetical protein K2X47_00465, partial [Bdellovibrionales bacterium]|nr:hypothetical protein [Bdellovibrionales bacterium]